MGQLHRVNRKVAANKARRKRKREERKKREKERDSTTDAVRLVHDLRVGWMRAARRGGCVGRRWVRKGGFERRKADAAFVASRLGSEEMERCKGGTKEDRERKGRDTRVVVDGIKLG